MKTTLIKCLNINICVKRNQKEYICILTKRLLKKIKMLQNNPQVITKNLNKLVRHAIIDKHKPCT